MPVYALNPGYQGERMDRVENFHGNQIVYLGWDEHRMFCAAKAFPLPPSMPFAALIDNIMPEAFGQHPEFSQINWDTAEWLLDGEPFKPQLEVALEDQGVGHKSLIRFKTPELTGYQGAGV
ncbi:phenol hydroxylase subunit P4 [Amphritea atlantica]|uniref:phenol hydroxylase subunit P4 n=1 Tax=Amphritea atlantica TaxID=355243 RepID=UPI0021C3525D|nr:phenol hydroxylase subunit P4 [Amphritea atlantica]